MENFFGEELTEIDSHGIDAEQTDEQTDDLGVGEIEAKTRDLMFKPYRDFGDLFRERTSSMQPESLPSRARGDHGSVERHFLYKNGTSAHDERRETQRDLQYS